MLYAENSGYQFVTVADKATIKTAFESDIAWCADNTETPINDGYPVLLWQRTWTPVATATPVVTATPTATPTAKPTATPTAKPTATPTPAPTSTPVPTPIPSQNPGESWNGGVDTEWAGTGTSTDPYLISTPAELAGLAKTIFDAVSTTASTEKMPIAKSLRRQNDMYFAYTGKYFKLTSDIDLNNKEWMPIGRMYMRFDGIFDGNGHTIKNVKITKEYSAAGLFGATGRNATVKNLGVDGIDIATTVGGTVTDYEATGDITRSVNRARAYGGLVASLATGGSESNPLLENCFVRNVKIEATTKNMNHGCMGGLFGTAEYMTASATNGTKDQDPTNTATKFYVKNCYVVNVDLKGYTSVGAFYGGNYGFFAYDYRTTPQLTNCYVAGDINIAYNSGEQAGFGFNFGSLHNAGAVVYTNSYTSANSYTAETQDVYADKAGIVSAFDNAWGWSKDHATTPINNGYPILSWQNTWEPQPTPTPTPAPTPTYLQRYRLFLT